MRQQCIMHKIFQNKNIWNEIECVMLLLNTAQSNYYSIASSIQFVMFTPWSRQVGAGEER